jgi:hypothetical protein
MSCGWTCGGFKGLHVGCMWVQDRRTRCLDASGAVLRSVDVNVSLSSSCRTTIESTCWHIQEECHRVVTAQGTGTMQNDARVSHRKGCAYFESRPPRCSYAHVVSSVNASDWTLMRCSHLLWRARLGPHPDPISQLIILHVQFNQRSFYHVRHYSPWCVQFSHALLACGAASEPIASRGTA